MLGHSNGHVGHRSQRSCDYDLFCLEVGKKQVFSVKLTVTDNPAHWNHRQDPGNQEIYFMLMTAWAVSCLRWVPVAGGVFLLTESL